MCEKAEAEGKAGMSEAKRSCDCGEGIAAVLAVLKVLGLIDLSWWWILAACILGAWGCAAVLLVLFGCD